MNKTINYIWIALAAVCMFALPFNAIAGSFDGEKDLLCAPQKAIECSAERNCEQVSATSIDLPNFFMIDFSEKEITAISDSDSKRTSKINSLMVFLDGKLFLQGADDGVEDVRDGLAWSMSITQDTGRFVISASGENEAFVVFGACTPK